MSSKKTQHFESSWRTPLSPFFNRQGEFDNNRCVWNRLSLKDLGRQWKTGLTARRAVGEYGSNRPHPPLEGAEKEPEGVPKSPQEGLTMRRSLAVLLLRVACFCLAMQGVASAQADFDKKRGGPSQATLPELRGLPPVCAARYNWGHSLEGGSKLSLADMEEVKKWQNVFGDAFIHMHHYCNGLNLLNRIYRGIGDKETLLGLALGEFKYMQRIPADNVLRPEVEYNLGQVLYRMNRISEASGPIIKAIQLKPDFVQAYLLLSYCYRRVGDRTGAADVLQKGLTRVPDSRLLREALDELNELNPTKKEPDGGGHQ